MSLLTAVYDLRLKGSVLIYWPSDAQNVFKIDIADFKVEIVFASSVEDENYNDTSSLLRVFSSICIKVSRSECDDLPVLVEGGNRHCYYTMIEKYILKRKSSYGVVAVEAFNRAIRFFRYKFGMYQLQEVFQSHSAIESPKWYGDDGAQIRLNSLGVILTAVRRIPGKYDITPDCPGIVDVFLGFINNEATKSTLEDVMVDALSALNSGDLRRAVLELAIATEIMVKRTVFPRGDLSGVAFDYIEDKARVRITVPELIDSVCKEAICGKYDDEYKEVYEAIQCLFKCRNKVAHRGELVYVDVKQELKVADARTVSSWRYAVIRLKAWLESLSL